MKLLILSLHLFLFTQGAHTSGFPGFKLFGKVLGQGVCQKGQTVLWVSHKVSGQAKEEYLYQSEVPMGGTFEFYLIPGSYNITGLNDKNCEKKVSFTIKDKQQSLNLELIPKS